MKYQVIRNEKYDYIGQSYSSLYPNLHKYPATMLPQIGVDVLKEFKAAKGILLDPYCGSGSSFASGFELSSYRSDIFRFYVPKEYEKRILSYISEKLNMKTERNGSIFAENAEIIVKDRRLFDEEALENLPPVKENDSFSYHLVTAIVQRGTADFAAKSLLEAGFGVPAICFSKGMGLRQKLGLLRIVIPTDKEVLMILVPPSNTESVVDLIRKSAQLNSPGKGVVFVEKVRAMNVNIRIYLG